MNSMSMQWGSRLGGLGLLVGLTAGFAVAVRAQSVTGQAYGASVNTQGVSSGQAPLAVLPAISGTDGAEADAEAPALSVPNALSSTFLNSITSGELGAGAGNAGAQSTASAANVNILNGLITADEVIVNVSSSVTPSGAVSNADGSTFTNLTVAGVSVTTGDGTVAPNTSIALQGGGFVVLNEQIPSGDGVASSGLTVNMIHVYLQGGATMSGEIIVGSASSSVGP
jgi:hypothetical protein